jgi:phospholipid/cholesterol/gamma-HCH transport system substrate-binding protein
MAATKTEFTATEIKAGLLVLASLVILLVLIATIRGCRPQDENVKRYQAAFTDIGGLNMRADVRFGGVQVGRVVRIESDARDRRMILVTAEVGADVPVNRASVASIKQVSLTAEKHLEISTGTADAELLEDGDSIPTRAGGNGFFDVPDLNGVTTRLETLLDSVIMLVGAPPSEPGAEGQPAEIVDLSEVLASLRATLDQSAATANDLSSVIAENRVEIREVVQRMAELEASATELTTLLAAVVSENRAPLAATIANLQRVSEETSRRLEEVADSLTAALQPLHDLGGNASDLLDDQRPDLVEIVDNLRVTTENLRRLSEILADQPSALIRGARPQGRQNGER